MYDIILKDGEHYTKFDKTYLIKPEGYDFVLLKDPQVKLQAKNKKYIISRPNFTSAFRLQNGSEASAKITNNSRDTVHQFFDPLQMKKRYQGLIPGNKNYEARGSMNVSYGRSAGQIRATVLDRNHTLEVNHQSRGNNYNNISISNQATAKGGLIPVDNNSKEVASHIHSINNTFTNSVDYDEINDHEHQNGDHFEQFNEDASDEYVDDKVDELFINIKDGEHNQAINNILELKKKMFDQELKIIFAKFDDKIKECHEKYLTKFEEYTKRVEERINENSQFLETF